MDICLVIIMSLVLYLSYLRLMVVLEADIKEVLLWSFPPLAILVIIIKEIKNKKNNKTYEKKER